MSIHHPPRAGRQNLTVVPEVMANNLATRRTLIARNRPIWYLLCSRPVVARANVTQKLTIAMKSILVQLCRRYGRLRWVWLVDSSTLSRNGNAIESLGLSDLSAFERNVGSEGLRMCECICCAAAMVFSTMGDFDCTVSDRARDDDLPLASVVVAERGMGVDACDRTKGRARFRRKLCRRWVIVVPRCSCPCEWDAVTEGVRARLKLASAAVLDDRVMSGYVANGD